MTEQRGINSVHKALIDEGDDMGGWKGLVGPDGDSMTHKVEDTLAERGARYGDFSDHARIAQDLQDVMRNSVVRTDDGVMAGSESCWHQLAPVQKQALTVIADKIARILSGDPNYKDSWHDIQGYAKLVEDRLP